MSLPLTADGNSVVVVSADPSGDWLHLALASYHKCDFPVTWNCRHLANANKFRHIRRVNDILGLFVPALVPPRSYLEEAIKQNLSVADKARR